MKLAVVGTMLPLVSVGCQEAQPSATLPSSLPAQAAAQVPASEGGARVALSGVAQHAPAPSPRAQRATPAQPMPVNPGPMPGPCGDMPLLLPYWREGALEFPTPLVAKLHLVIDRHFADCGAADCYGHDVELTLALAKSARGCGIQSAASTSKSWGCQPEKPRWRNEWRVQGGPLLTSPDLEWVVLRDRAKAQAIELGRLRYFFYDKVIPGARLLRRLENEDDDPKDCCFGFTNSKTN